MTYVREKISSSYEDLKEALGITNKMEAPRLIKVVVNVGTGSIKDNRKKELVVDRLARITGQQPSIRGARKSIAGFKIREGDPVGVTVTLRGEKMYAFIDRLINIAIPRMRDFQGIKSSSIDEIGNLTFGVPEHTVFPETADEDLRDVFGLSVTAVTSAKNKQDALLFLKKIGFPLAD